VRISPQIEYKGETKTLVEWSRHLGINQHRLGNRYRAGKRGDDLFNQDNLTHHLIKYQGITKSFSEWCRCLGVSHKTAHNRYALGLDLDLVFSTEKLNRSTKAPDGFTYKGVTKPLSKWCKEFKLSYGAVMYRIENKWPENRLFEPAIRNRSTISIEYLGDKKSLTAWCTHLNLGYVPTLMKFNNGLPLEDVFRRMQGGSTEKLNYEYHWGNKLKRIKKQEKAEKEIFQALIGKMRRKRYLLFRSYLREAEAESIMRVSA
jgi:hypothetical protein